MLTATKKVRKTSSKSNKNIVLQEFTIPSDFSQREVHKIQRWIDKLIPSLRDQSEEARVAEAPKFSRLGRNQRHILTIMVGSGFVSKSGLTGILAVQFKSTIAALIMRNLVEQIGNRFYLKDGVKKILITEYI